MTTPVNELHQQSATTLHNESFGEVGLSFTAICGAVVGAIGGAALGAQVGNILPTVCGGMLGTMLGSGLAAGIWCLIEKLWKPTH